MGEIISLQDGLYSYELPPLPKESDIWYYDLPKNQQYWKTPHNKNFKWLNQLGGIRNVKQMTEKERVEYINYWRDKWANGLWIMINGNPTWLAPAHVEHLVFNKFKSGYFYYLDSQRERFYFRDKADKDPLCDGTLWCKGRRVGITMEQVTHSIRTILSGSFYHVGFQSDEYKKTRSTLLNPMIDAYAKRPYWMRETYYSNNGRVPRGKLELLESVITNDDNYALGGVARAFPTTSKALDGEEFMLVVMDEVSKWAGVSPYETFEVNKKTIVNPDRRGKIVLLSTTGDSEQAKKSVNEWHKLISDSNPQHLNPNGQTNSGLWHYFVSYIHSLELLEKYPAIKDKYGFINKEMAEEYIWNDINKYPKDSKEYTYALYKQPMEMRHALLTPTGQGYFSKIRISARLDELRGMANYEKPYVRGIFEEDVNGKVYFKSDTERQKEQDRENEQNGTYFSITAGNWLIALHPYFSRETEIDTRNRFRRINGVYFPPVNVEFCIGYDPIRYRKEDTSSNHLSEAAIIVYKKHDYFGSGYSNRYAALYLHRPDDPRDANKECIKAAKYFAAPVMHERVIESVKEDFIEANCLPFLMKNEKDGLYGMWIDSGGKVVKNSLDMMVTRFSLPKTDDDIDQIAEMPFEDVLTDMDAFDIGNTTSYDTMMAMVELEQGLKQINYTNVTDNSNSLKFAIAKEIFAPRV